MATTFVPKVPKGYTFEDMQYAFMDGKLTTVEAIECGVLDPELAYEADTITAEQAAAYGVGSDVINWWTAARAGAS